MNKLQKKHGGKINRKLFLPSESQGVGQNTKHNCHMLRQVRGEKGTRNIDTIDLSRGYWKKTKLVALLPKKTPAYTG